MDWMGDENSKLAALGSMASDPGIRWRNRSVSASCGSRAKCFRSTRGGWRDDDGSGEGIALDSRASAEQ